MVNCNLEVLKGCHIHGYKSTSQMMKPCHTFSRTFLRIVRGSHQSSESAARVYSPGDSVHTASRCAALLIPYRIIVNTLRSTACEAHRAAVRSAVLRPYGQACTSLDRLVLFTYLRMYAYPFIMFDLKSAADTDMLTRQKMCTYRSLLM
jgi:hypothetical protein